MDPFVLVRHARPLQDPSLPPAQWSLDPGGAEAIAELVDVVIRLGLQRIRASSEPKALQTGRALAELLEVPAEPDPRLNEVHRPWVGDDCRFMETMQSYLAGDAVTGWEPQETVVARMRDAAADALETGFVGLVSHGTALALFVAHLGLVRAADFWVQLTSPDAWLVDGSTIRRLGASG